MKPNQTVKSCHVVLLCVFAGLVLILAGCGRKAAPVPPGIPDLQPVRALSHEVVSDTVTLTWEEPDGSWKSKLAGYSVYRSAISVNEKECPGCPIRFQRVADLKSGKEEYSENLKKGYRYIYKVVAYSEFNTFSNDSKLIRFTH